MGRCAAGRFNEGGGESPACRGGTGKIIRNENDIGAWPACKGGEAPRDSDDDGIPDASKESHGLNPNDPDDANHITAAGCTNLEHYLNNLVATHP